MCQVVWCPNVQAHYLSKNSAPFFEMILPIINIIYTAPHSPHTLPICCWRTYFSQMQTLIWLKAHIPNDDDDLTCLCWCHGDGLSEPRLGLTKSSPSLDWPLMSTDSTLYKLQFSRPFSKCYARAKLGLRVIFY